MQNPPPEPIMEISASAEPKFREAIERFFNGVIKISHDHMESNFAILKKPLFELQNLKVRYRVISDRSCFCFVDKATGNVLKSDGWTRPAKHARGNIFDAQNGLGSIGPYGPAYLR